MNKLRSIVIFSLLFFFLVFCTYCGFSKDLDQKSQLASGQLKNGLRFFVQKNSYDKQKASLRLVVKTGSSSEELDQRGLAHFVEHMVFRGSENFSDGEVIKFLESIGASFGADTNAYTSFDETVYHLDIPLDQENSLERGLKILADFSSKALFDEELVEKEKDVILDELRLRFNNCFGRYLEKIFSLAYAGTRYADRLPGGSSQIVKNASRDDLYRFYKKWYRPDNMAIIAVGDFDHKKVSQKIKEAFSDIKRPEENLVSIQQKLPQRLQNQALICRDQEAVMSYFELVALKEKQPCLTEEDIKRDFLISIGMSIFNKRLSDLSQRDDSPFKQATFNQNSSVRDFETVSLTVMPWDLKKKQALEKALQQLYLFVSQGITAQELQEKVADLKTLYQNLLENKDNRKNGVYVDTLISHYLSQEPLIPKKPQFYLSLLEQVTVEDVAAVIQKQDYLNIKWSVSLLTPSNDLDFSETDLVALVDGASLLDDEGDKIVKPEEKKVFHIEPERSEGFIADTIFYPDTQIEKLTLSNGLTIYLKHSDLKKNMFCFSLFAEGGLNCIQEQLAHSALVAAAYASESGLAGLGPNELQSALSGSSAQINYFLDLTERSISGSSSNEDIEVACQLVYAFFHHKYYKESAWNRLMAMYQEYLKTKNNNPEIRFSEFVQKLAHRNHYLFEDLDLNKTDPLQAQHILETMFSDPSQFTMVVVGDFDKENLKKHFDRYLANIFSEKKSLKTLFDAFPFPDSSLEKVIEGGISEKARTKIIFPISIDSYKETKEDYSKLELAVELIDQRLRDAIRLNFSKTYNIDATLSMPFSPKISSAKLCISFSCDPSRFDEVLSLVKSELKEITTQDITDQELKVVKELRKQQLKEEDKSLVGLLQKIKTRLDFQEGLEKDFDDEEMLSSLSLEEVNHLMKQLINFDRYLCLSQKS